jgi:hypothetical protein
MTGRARVRADAGVGVDVRGEDAVVPRSHHESE